MKVTLAEPGVIALIQQDEFGTIRQIALTVEQSNLLQIFLATISKESPLIKMGEEYELILKSSIQHLIK